MNEMQKRVLKVKYRENCFILASFPQRPYEDTEGDFRVKTWMSFLYDTGDVCTEWEPMYGPIQIWYRCDADTDGAREHYFYDYQRSGDSGWSQMAVDRHELPQAAHRGDFDYIFDVLKYWAE